MNYQEAFNDIIYHMPYEKQRAYDKQIDTLQKAIDDLELYKKALDISCQELEDGWGVEMWNVKYKVKREWKGCILQQARKEL